MSLSALRLLLVPCLVLSLGSVLCAENRFTRWFTSKEDSFPGSRQKVAHGKTWPLQPRPAGPAEPLVHRYHTAKYWPDPYRWEDRATVRDHLCAQTSAGWITATTLYDQHFDPITQDINQAGKLHLNWILLHAPASHRLAWVAAAGNSEDSQKRLLNVQAEAAAIAGPNMPPVLLRVAMPTGTSAHEVDLIRRAYLGSMPQPRIPFDTLSEGGAGGSSGGAN